MLSKIWETCITWVAIRKGVHFCWIRKGFVALFFHWWGSQLLLCFGGGCPNFTEHSGNIQGTFGEYSKSGNIQGTFGKHEISPRLCLILSSLRENLRPCVHLHLDTCTRSDHQSSHNNNHNHNNNNKHAHASTTDSFTQLTVPYWYSLTAAFLPNLTSVVDGLPLVTCGEYSLSLTSYWPRVEIISFLWRPIGTH
jgi:hypothetical protein